MNTHEDFEDFLRLLNENKVEYVIVGGYAVAFHGYVRVTKDLDILFRNERATILKLIDVLNQFGFSTESLTETAFSEHGKIVRMGVAPVMIELINAISGLDFDQIWRNRVKGDYGNIEVNFISKQDLIVNKKASGRPQDLADVDELS